MEQNERFEGEYRDALDSLRFAEDGKERMMKNLMERQAGQPVKGKGFRPLRAGLIAAALCLALAGTAVAVQVFDVRVDLQTNPVHPGDNYTVTGGIAFFPVEGFPQQVQDLAVPHEITGQNFTSWAEAEEFLGRSLPHSTVLDSAEPGLSAKVSGSDRTSHILLRTNTADQGLCSIGVEGHYLLDGLWIQQSALLYTDKAEQNHLEYGLEGEEFKGGVVMVYEEGSAMTEETYTTPGGLTATIVGVTPAPGALRPTTDYNAHFSINGIQYSVLVRFYMVGRTPAEAAAADDPAHTLAVLKQVLDGFVV